MLLTILGLVDVALGIVLAASPYFNYTGMAVIGTLAVIALIKGVFSVLSAAAGGYYFSVESWLDIIVGVLLLTTTFGVHFSWFLWIGIFEAAKGVYSIFSEMIGD